MGARTITWAEARERCDQILREAEERRRAGRFEEPSYCCEEAVATFRREAARAICDRCRESRWEVILQDGDYWHSAEETQEGVGIPPVPCAADAIWKLTTR